MEEKQRQISKAVISRLPSYYRYLGDLLKEGKTRISSQQLSSIMKLTASQIRQDLNNFGGFGQQGYGYNIEYLFREIGKILGVEKTHNLIVMGAGNLGRALVNYRGFSSHGFIFLSFFDISEELIGKYIGPVLIRHLNELAVFTAHNRVEIAVITVPKSSAKDTAKKLYTLGIRAFWNFSGTDLDLPSDAEIKNVYLLDSLLELSYASNKFMEKE